MVREHGLDYLDLCGDLGPFDLSAHAVGPGFPSAPDFSALAGDAAQFTPTDAPMQFNSEPSVARFLGQLAYYRRAATIFELGCFVGWTTAHLAAGVKAHGGPARVYAVDYMQPYLDVTRANLARHGLDAEVVTIRGMSTHAEVMARLPARADIVFIDTSHAYPDTRDEILAYLPRLAPGGCFVLHDCVSASGVRRSVHELRAKFRTHIFATERSNGVAVLFPR